MANSQKPQKIYMVTGKGGVGKSVIAAGMAKEMAYRGNRVLLVELGEESYFAKVFNKDVRYEPTQLEPNLWVSLWSGESCLREYIHHLIKVKTIADLFFDNRIMKTFIKAAPALKELAILGKITSGVRKWGPPLNFDVIVVDAFSTGHYLALLKAPIGMAELIESGPMGEQSRNMTAVLANSQHTTHVIVTIPEELPVSEAIELDKELKALTKLTPTIILNKYYDEKNISGINLENKFSANTEQFSQFLKNLFHRQSTQVQKLKESGLSYHVAPLILEAKISDVVDGISRALSGVFRD